MPDSRLRIVRWQLAQQERLINDQRALIGRLRAAGLPTHDAENLLRQMYDMLAFRQLSLRNCQLSVTDPRPIERDLARMPAVIEEDATAEGLLDQPNRR